MRIIMMMIMRRTRRNIRGAGLVTGIGQMSNAYKIFVGKPERRRLIGRPRHR
jgi:hypothetical protein